MSLGGEREQDEEFKLFQSKRVNGRVRRGGGQGQSGGRGVREWGLGGHLIEAGNCCWVATKAETIKTKEEEDEETKKTSHECAEYKVQGSEVCC